MKFKKNYSMQNTVANIIDSKLQYNYYNIKTI